LRRIIRAARGEVRARFHIIRQNLLLYQLRPDIGAEARLTTVGSYAILYRVTGDACASSA
jgi:hypothetical protein